MPSARRFCEQLEYNLLFKWFLDLNIDDPAFDASTFSKNQERLLKHDVARQFLAAVTAEAKRRQLLSSDHFTVDGTLLQAWASLKSVHPRDDGDDAPPQAGGRNREVDFRGQRRRNETHVSRTDSEARLARKGDGQETKLCFAGHVLMENRNGLVVDMALTEATGTSEREAALRLLERRGNRKRATVAADKAYDTADFVTGCRALNVTPQVAQHTTRRRSRIDRRTTRHPGLRRRPAHPQAGRGDLRLDEDGGRRAEAPVSRRSAERSLGDDRRGRIQPRQDGPYRTGAGDRIERGAAAAALQRQQEGGARSTFR